MVASELCGMTSSVQGAKAARLLIKRFLELRESEERLIQNDKHLAEEFARRSEWAGSYGAFFRAIFQFSSRFHLALRFVWFAFRQQSPGLDFLLLNFHLQRPIFFA